MTNDGSSGIKDHPVGKGGKAVHLRGAGRQGDVGRAGRTAGVVVIAAGALIIARAIGVA